MTDDREHALGLTPVSRETTVRLDRFVALLREWQPRINLVAPSTIDRVWMRHIADSLQLLPLGRGGRTWVDLGSGGGFPGLVLACALAEQRGARVHLVESNRKKAAFLREAVRVTDAPAEIHAQRISDFVEDFEDKPAVVTARALAPLTDLLAQSLPLFDRGAMGLFPKGQDVDAELKQATIYWNLQAELVPSKTDPSGRIVIIDQIHRRAPGS